MSFHVTARGQSFFLHNIYIYACVCRIKIEESEDFQSSVIQTRYIYKHDRVLLKVESNRMSRFHRIYIVYIYIFSHVRAFPKFNFERLPLFTYIFLRGRIFITAVQIYLLQSWTNYIIISDNYVLSLNTCAMCSD